MVCKLYLNKAIKIRIFVGTLFFLKNFYWSIVDLKYCASAVHQSESVIHIQISTLF